MDAVSSEDYDKIKQYVKNTDGTELTEQQISNFLVNTGLYRATIKSENRVFTYSATANFFNTRKGSILFTFTALNEELITNEMSYAREGVNEYLITDKTKDINVEKERYPIALDLANGDNITYDSLKNNYTEKIMMGSFVQDENGKVFIEIIKEAKEDIKVSLLKDIYDIKTSLKNIDENYNIEWSDDFKEFSIYYDESVEKKVIAPVTRIEIFASSLLMQVLYENEDWNLTINYYDYNTKQLLKTEKIR
jgi:hypothetical protein